MRFSSKLTIAAVGTVAVALVGYGVADAVTPSSPNATSAAHQTQAPAVAAKRVAVPGQTQSSTFTPITPCRIVDTRVAGGIIVHSSTRTFQVTGTTGFTGQGGAAAGCGIPSYATSAAVSLTAVRGTNSNFLTVFPTGAPKPLSTVLTFTKNVTISAGTDVTLGTGGRINTYIGGNANTNLVIDVNGYYAAPIAGVITISGSVYSGTGRITATSHPSAGNYTLTADMNLSGCTAYATMYENQFYANAHVSGTNSIVVQVWTLSGGTPVLTDRAFEYHVLCG